MYTPGEEVKAKKENHLTRTRAREREEREKKGENKGGFERKSATLIQKSYNKNTQEHVIAIQRETTTFAIETISNNLSSI